MRRKQYLPWPTMVVGFIGTAYRTYLTLCDSSDTLKLE